MESVLSVYRDARRNGNVEQWVNDSLLNRRTEGLAILATLRSAIAKPIPKVDLEIRDFWRQSVELMGSLQEGLSAIEAVIVWHKISSRPG
jgi:hypothetical protein